MPSLGQTARSRRQRRCRTACSFSVAGPSASRCPRPTATWARRASAHILGRDVELRSDGALSPRVTFCEPQVAAVGHTLASALDAGIAARAVDVGTSATAGGSFYGRDAPGTARIVVDTDREV